MGLVGGGRERRGALSYSFISIPTGSRPHVYSNAKVGSTWSDPLLEVLQVGAVRLAVPDCK